MFIAHVCPLCGGKLERKEKSYFCKFCSTNFEEDKVERFTDSISKLLDGEKQEKLANLKNLLWVELHEKKYVDSDRILELTKDILKLYPDDYIAGFFYTANNNEITATAEKIAKFDVRNYGYAVEWVLDFVINSLEQSYVLPTSDLIERAFKNKNLDKYHDYSSRLSQEAERVENGIYDLTIPRDVFVCYSSKDMPKVLELTASFDDDGISYFVAAKNLRQGAGAVQNYEEAIKTAMDYCKIIVFVSTVNSRNRACDATKFEIPYIRSKDVAKAPVEYSYDYEKIPAIYKKPRVEYLLDKYTDKAIESVVKEFFSGNQWCYSKNEVNKRVLDILSNGWAKPLVDEEKLEAKQKLKEAEEERKRLIEEQNKKLKEFEEEKERIKEEAEAKQKLLAEQVKRLKELERERIKEESDKRNAYSETDKSDIISTAQTQDNSDVEIQREGDYILFGTYPQSEVKDLELRASLNNVAGSLPTEENPQNWISYGYHIEGKKQDYMWYIDIKYNENKYRGIYFTKYRPHYTTESKKTVQNKNGYSVNIVYWFKYEPIKWRILEHNAEETLILSDKIIDAQPFCFSSSSNANNYAHSDIRKWLNDTFYNTAFASRENSVIKLTTIDNSTRSADPQYNLTKSWNGNNSYVCEDTQDKLFLLSVQEVTNDAYKFNVNAKKLDTARIKTPTDYAKSQGCYTLFGSGDWWLRSPSDKNDEESYIVYGGGDANYKYSVRSTEKGVVPALKIDVSRVDRH